ncbi:MAG: hypothetical protein D6681_20225 [Calditrichaeota bacterium]|nr:MAG: hypothetical protein D6681_20225 [Calditrichota bacterium]
MSAVTLLLLSLVTALGFNFGEISKLIFGDKELDFKKELARRNIKGRELAAFLKLREQARREAQQAVRASRERADRKQFLRSQADLQSAALQAELLRSNLGLAQSSLQGQTFLGGSGLAADALSGQAAAASQLREALRRLIQANPQTPLEAAGLF